MFCFYTWTFWSFVAFSLPLCSLDAPFSVSEIRINESTLSWNHISSCLHTYPRISYFPATPVSQNRTLYPFLRWYFKRLFCFYFMYMNILLSHISYVNVLRVRLISEDVRGGHQILWNWSYGVISYYVGGGNHTGVLCKSRKCSSPLNHLSILFLD